MDLKFLMRSNPTPTEHPLDVMRTLGITYKVAIPQVLGLITDEWWFFDCDIPEGVELPSYMEELRLKDSDEPVDSVVFLREEYQNAMNVLTMLYRIPLAAAAFTRAADEIEQLRADVERLMLLVSADCTDCASKPKQGLGDEQQTTQHDGPGDARCGSIREDGGPQLLPAHR